MTHCRAAPFILILIRGLITHRALRLYRVSAVSRRNTPISISERRSKSDRVSRDDVPPDCRRAASMIEASLAPCARISVAFAVSRRVLSNTRVAASARSLSRLGASSPRYGHFMMTACILPRVFRGALRRGVVDHATAWMLAITRR